MEGIQRRKIKIINALTCAKEQGFGSKEETGLGRIQSSNVPNAAADVTVLPAHAHRTSSLTAQK